MPRSSRKGPLRGKAKKAKSEKYAFRSTKATVKLKAVTTKEALKALETVIVEDTPKADETLETVTINETPKAAENISESVALEPNQNAAGSDMKLNVVRHKDHMYNQSGSGGW